MSNEIEPIKKNGSFSDISEFTKHIEPSDFHSNKCKFCCSEFRQAAEREYEKIAGASGAISAIHKFLISRGESISLSSVKNHINYHFGKKVSEERMKEYGEEVEKWKSLRPSKEKRLQEFIDILYRRIHIIEANSDIQSGKDKLKHSETIVKLMDQVNKCQAEIDKHKNQTGMIKVFIDNFVDIVQKHMEEIPSREATKALAEALTSVLEEAQKMVGDLSENE